MCEPKAPETVYLNPSVFSVDLLGADLSKRQYAEDIEYVRKDLVRTWRPIEEVKIFKKKGKEVLIKIKYGNTIDINLVHWVGAEIQCWEDRCGHRFSEKSEKFKIIEFMEIRRGQEHELYAR